MPIQINDLCKSFDDRPVISHLTLTIPDNKCTVIMGPSGCGKTTLLQILMGLLAADAGTITGIPLRKSAVFQEDRLCEEFSSLTNVRIVTGKSCTDETIRRHLISVGLKDSLSQPVHELSGGMKRRVAIVRAVLADAEIIFLDEPFKGLDAGTKEEVMQYFRTHTRGKTTLLVTHDASEADILGAQRVVLADMNVSSCCDDRME